MKLPLLPIVVGMSLASGAALGLLYMLFKKDDEIESGGKRANTVTTCKRVITISVKIPKDAVGIVIGRGGANIREIQDETKTKINFNDETATEAHRECLITGLPANVQQAASLIHDIIRNQPLITTSEMKVPSRACGRIIGRCGENIRAIIQASGAKVTVETASNQSDKYGDRRIMLKGSADQIIVAKSMISEKVDEDNKLRKQGEDGGSNRTPRTNKSPQYLTAGNKQEAATEEESHGERLSTNSSGGMMEVYVSAVESPDRFWVQVVSPSAVELDQLLAQMTEYYMKEENQELHVIENLSVGQYVAAPFLSDEKWYRAQVVGIEQDEYDAAETQVVLYYVDYGDTQNARPRVVLELRADFLKLTFQAIECSLAKVKPRGSEWSVEASDLFEDLTYNAKWKVMMCSIEHYDTDRTRLRARGRREGSPVPVVNLFDIDGPKDIDVAHELVKNQFAVYSAPPVAKPAVKPNVTTTNWAVSSSTGAVVPESSASASSAPSNRSGASSASASSAPSNRSEASGAAGGAPARGTGKSPNGATARGTGESLNGAPARGTGESPNGATARVTGESPNGATATNGQSMPVPLSNRAALKVDNNKMFRKVKVYEDDDDDMDLY